MASQVTVTADVNSDVKKVWDYYTKPEHITQWNFADPSWHCPSASNELRVGGKYVARMEAKDGSFGFDLEGIYTEMILGKRFSFTMADRSVTAEFIKSGGHTIVNISFDPETENPIEMQRNGWQAILDNFKKYTEQN